MFNYTTLFELSWEVCNKVGGIHTVITSKKRYIKNSFTDYFLVGPYLDNSDFIETNEIIPEKYLSPIKELEKKGIKIHFGYEKRFVDENNDSNNKNITGRGGLELVKVILVEYLDYSKNINDIKKLLWERHKIDSLNSQWYDFDEVMLWAWSCGVVIEELSKKIEDKVIVHAHEWMSGASILYLNYSDIKDKYRGVFTTHATMLGRSISGSGRDLYEIEDKIDPDKMAYEVGVHTKHQLEKAVANEADCFTTVSDITGKEAEIFYKKKPDYIVYNGFNTLDMPDENYDSSKEYLLDFTKGFFNDFYRFDVDNSCFIFTSGRNEFRNKGVDLIIDSVNKLNDRLINENSNKNVILFILVPIGEFSKDEFVVESIKNYNEGRWDLNEQSEYAPICTNEMPINNDIINALVSKKLLNHYEDKVKVILIPDYINENNYFIPKDYYEFTSAFDLGMFPSIYEPWGYTPVECLVTGVKTLTSDLSGFGIYINENYKDNDNVKILERREKDYETSTTELCEYLYNFSKDYDRKKVKNFSLNFDWHVFIENYIRAYDYVLNLKR